MSSSETGQIDYVIVGGGSAGCVLAARLSENPGTRVLLLEAGVDAARPEDFPDLASAYPGKAYSNPTWTWPGMKATFAWSGSNQPTSRATRYEQARVLGGGSAINGIGANRGAPSDYDEWGELGATGWSWSTCLPYFRKLERDLDFDNDLHGQTGPFPIRRRGPEIWTPFTHAMVALCKARGIEFLSDQNGPWQDGIFEMAVNMDEAKRRVSTAWGWLTPEVRKRPNLEIRVETTVQRVLFQGTRAIGVLARRGGETTRINAARIVLAAGALATPALMMRSGLGPGGHLSACGVTTIRNLPGVGQNLMEHPSIGLVPWLRPSARQRGPLDYHIPIGFRFSSGIQDAPNGDMHMNFVTRAAWHPLGQRLGSIFFWVNKSYSRGQLMLNPVALDGPVEIDFRMLSDRRDLVRLADAFERAVSLGSDPALRHVIAGLYAGGMSEIGRRFSKPSLTGQALTAVAAAGLDAAGGLRDWFLPAILANFHDPVRLASDREALEAYISRNVGGVWHPSCTCKMGSRRDPTAVTDPNGQVYGGEGLFICDASVMPSIPCANTNLPTIMIAEKISDSLKRVD